MLIEPNKKLLVIHNKDPNFFHSDIDESKTYNIHVKYNAQELNPKTTTLELLFHDENHYSYYGNVSNWVSKHLALIEGNQYVLPVKFNLLKDRTTFHCGYKTGKKLILYRYIVLLNLKVFDVTNKKFMYPIK